MGRPKKIIAKKFISDDHISKLQGCWIDESYIKYPVVRENTDVYYIDDSGNEKLLLKFRKDCFTNSLIHNGWNSYKDLAKPSRGRGASAGPIDVNGQYFSKRELVNTNKWSTGYLKPDGKKMKQDLLTKDINEIIIIAKKYNISTENNSKDTIINEIIKKNNGISNMKINNQVASNAIGFYEAQKNLGRDHPCRLTHFTRTNYDNYKNGLPFIEKIDSMFKKLIPESYEKQFNRASQKPHLKISDTSFSTVTINRNFRTALHRDAGDYKEGFGNLTVIRRGKYHGGYTIFPQFGVAVDVDTKDFLAMDVHQWHSNTPIYQSKEDKLFNEQLTPVFKENPDVGTAGIYENYTRLTFVCYLREKILSCPNEIDSKYLTKCEKKKN
tara:strand:+ start:814 stop:1962 length:1149 start_codon:yes stop_codon:yes gene_type:complete